MHQKPGYTHNVHRPSYVYTHSTYKPSSSNKPSYSPWTQNRPSASGHDPFVNRPEAAIGTGDFDNYLPTTTTTTTDIYNPVEDYSNSVDSFRYRGNRDPNFLGNSFCTYCFSANLHFFFFFYFTNILLEGLRKFFFFPM